MHCLNVDTKEVFTNPKTNRKINTEKIIIVFLKKFEIQKIFAFFCLVFLPKDLNPTTFI